MGKVGGKSLPVRAAGQFSVYVQGAAIGFTDVRQDFELVRGETMKVFVFRCRQCQVIEARTEDEDQDS